MQGVKMYTLCEKKQLALLPGYQACKPRALNEMPPRADPSSAERLFKKIAAKDWAFKSDMEDLLHFLGNRLNSCEFDFSVFANLIGVTWQRVCFRPDARSNFASEFEAAHAEDAALLLIVLERVGFQTDATALVEILLPNIKSRKKCFFLWQSWKSFGFLKPIISTPE